MNLFVVMAFPSISIFSLLYRFSLLGFSPVKEWAKMHAPWQRVLATYHEALLLLRASIQLPSNDKWGELRKPSLVLLGR